MYVEIVEAKGVVRISESSQPFRYVVSSSRTKKGRKSDVDCEKMNT